MIQGLATVRENTILSTLSYRSRGRRVVESRLLLLECPELAVSARPGQFVMVVCGEKCTLPRPFSIHRIQDRKTIVLFFNVWEDGKGSEWLAQRHPGDTVAVFGPLGNSFTVIPASKRLLLVAGGVGIAPLGFLAEQATTEGHAVTVLVGARTSGQLYPERLLPPGIRTVLATEDDTEGEQGLVTDLLPAYTGEADQVFACGPADMYRDIYRRRQELGLTGKTVQVSLETGMACGRGVCYGCTVKTINGPRQVCQHGPVFDMDEVLWDELR